MALLQPKVPFWVFPCACWNPYFCSVWWLWMGTKRRTIFQQQIVATKMHVFCTFRTQIVFANFSLKCHLTKKSYFLHNHPKTLFCCFFFLFSFPFFRSFLFWFIQHKKTKAKCTFLSKTLSLTPWQTAQKIFSHPMHTICFLRHPKTL